jgi:hypothetical protein
MLPRHRPCSAPLPAVERRQEYDGALDRKEQKSNLLLERKSSTPNRRPAHPNLTLEAAVSLGAALVSDGNTDSRNIAEIARPFLACSMRACTEDTRDQSRALSQISGLFI